MTPGLVYDRFTKMIFSQKELERTAELAHLHLQDAEKIELLPQLQHILGHVQTLNTLSTDHIQTSASVVETPLRKDDTAKPFPVDLAQNAPLFEQDCFKVPKILSEE